VIELGAFETEVRDLHAFFERWFAGTAEPSELERLDVLDESFQMIGPDGHLHAVDQVRSTIEDAYGRRTLQIAIRNVSVHPVAPVGMYEEWHAPSGDLAPRRSSVTIVQAA